jgi:hypothetical protein
VPVTLEQHERKLHDPALCEQLPVRDYLDNVVVRTNGAFVAGYELKGLASYFASDVGRYVFCSTGRAHLDQFGTRWTISTH